MKRVSVINCQKFLRSGLFARPLRILMLCLALFGVTGPALSATPNNLYGATVTTTGSDQQSLNDAFDAALGQVLVKVTGRVDASALRRQLFPDARKLLLQYRQVSDQEVFAAFDGNAIRRTLDSAGQPVWGEQRPLVTIWLAVDAGNGQRFILSDASQGSADTLEAVREQLLASASSRGLPVVLPLLDATDVTLVSFSDVWGGFINRMAQASARYNSEALLIGRVDSLSANARNVRWAFAYAGEQTGWQGTLASGPARVADFLASQDATTTTASDRIRLTVAGVNSIAAYGEIKKYLQGLNMVAEVSVARVQTDQIEFDLILRGETARLRQVLTNSRLLSPATEMTEAGVDYLFVNGR
jgi:hypothetical protein